MKDIFKKIVVFLLTLFARLVLRRYKPTIIAVTGNVGKTSTKDAIYTILSEAYYVRKSEKSFNSDIGVPLTILGLQNAWGSPFLWFQNICVGFSRVIIPEHYPKMLVLEVGADKPGDIKELTGWLRPHIVVVTRVGDVPVHVEQYRDKEEVVEEKTHLVRALREGGTLVMNADCPNIQGMKDHARGRTITFGRAGGDMQASNEEILYSEGVPKGILCKVSYGGSMFPLEITGTVGFHQIYPVLAALSVAVSLDMNMVSAVGWAGQFTPPPGRQKILKGISGSTLIDDSYNASPTAVEAALVTMGEVKALGRKIVVLGDMLELGKYSEEAHKHMGELVKKHGDIFVAVGVRMRSALKRAEEKRMAKKNLYLFEKSTDAGEFLKDFVKEGDVVLVKGSQSMRMERVVERILDGSVDKKTNLVRQEDAWKVR